MTWTHRKARRLVGAISAGCSPGAWTHNPANIPLKPGGVTVSRTDMTSFEQDRPGSCDAALAATMSIVVAQLYDQQRVCL